MEFGGMNDRSMSFVLIQTPRPKADTSVPAQWNASITTGFLRNLGMSVPELPVAGGLEQVVHILLRTHAQRVAQGESEAIVERGLAPFRLLQAFFELLLARPLHL